MTDGPDPRHPRVLVLAAQPVTRKHGTGITLSNLFAGWPSDRVAQLHLDPGTPDPDFCSRAMRLPHNGSPIEGLLRRPSTISREGKAAATTDIISARLPTGGQSSSRGWVSAAFDLLPAHLTRETVAWARDFGAEVIYTPLGSIRMMNLTRLIAARLDVPVVPHFMDDWPQTLFTHGEMFGLARRKVRQTLGDVAELSPVLMTISQTMADEFAAELKVPTAAFMNAVSDSELEIAAPPQASTGSLGFSYVGGLHLERWSTLRQLALGMSRTIGVDARLRIHAPTSHLEAHRAAFDGLDNVDLGPSLAADEVPGALRDADVLVHVESFNPEAQRYTRLSISTKIPQYMAARRPILAVGPSHLASMQHIEHAGAGLLVGSPDDSRLGDALMRLLAEDFRATLGNRGRAYVEAHHTQAAVARDFALRLAGVVESSERRRSGT